MSHGWPRHGPTGEGAGRASRGEDRCGREGLTVPDGMGLVNLIYASEAVVAPPLASAVASMGLEASTSRDVHDIVATSREHNAAHGITGVLVYDGTTFGQVLEGPDGAIEALFGRIRRDRRNRRVLALGIESIAERSFPSWSMGFVARAQPLRPPEFAGWSMAIRLAARRGEAMPELLEHLGGGRAAPA